MRRLMVVMTVIGVIAMAGVANASVYNDAVLADSPYLYWTFDEAVDAADAVSLVNQAASNDLVNYGATRGPSTTTTGGVSLGRAGYTPAWTSRFQTGVGNAPIVAVPWAVEFWFMSTSGDADQYIWTVPSENPLMLYGFNRRLGANEVEALSAWNVGWLAEPDVSPDVWHHVVLAWYFNLANEELWIDGVLADSSAGFSSDLPLDTLAVGGRNNGFGSNLNGAVDEFAIYMLSGDLAAQQAAVADIADHYNVAAVVIPEPAGLGLIGLALLAVRRKRS